MVHVAVVVIQLLELFLLLLRRMVHVDAGFMPLFWRERRAGPAGVATVVHRGYPVRALKPH